MVMMWLWEKHLRTGACRGVRKTDTNQVMRGNTPNHSFRSSLVPQYSTFSGQPNAEVR